MRKSLTVSAIFVCLLVLGLSIVSLAQKQSAQKQTNLVSSAAPKLISTPVSTANTPEKRTAMQALANLPLSFEVNEGQTDSRVKFLARGAGYALFLTQDRAVLALPHTSSQDNKPAMPAAPYAIPRASDDTGKPSQPAAGESVLSMKVVGANPAAKLQPLEKQVTESNYFIGNDPAKWHRGIENYSKIRYAAVYPGIDLVYYGKQGSLEYDFVVKPGADPTNIQMALGSGPEGQGHISMKVDASGNLIAALDGSEVQFHKPVIYQPAPATSEKESVAGGFVMQADGSVRFDVGPYDHSRELVIDPALGYSTYLGGSNEDIAYAVNYGVRFGYLLVAGTTRSSDYPTVIGLYPFGGGTCGTQPCRDIFVSKLNPTLTSLAFSTYVGGSGDDVALAMAQDPYGDFFLTGYTTSTNFPIAGNIFQRHFAGGSVTGDAIVVEVESAGKYLQYSSYLGGSGDDAGYGIAIDQVGNAFVVGSTTSTNFPVTSGAYQKTCGLNSGGTCSTAWVSEVNIAGSALTYSTYLGGSGGLGEAAYGVAVDTSDNAYIVGITGTPNFPTTTGAYQTKCGTNSLCNGTYDGFVSKMNPSGSGLVYSTFLGGSGYDYLSGVAVDTASNVYVAGGTISSDFPTTSGAAQTTYGGASAGCVPSASTVCGDVTVTKLNSGATALVYSTFLGGSGDESNGFSLALDSATNAYVTGFTDSANFPQVNAMQTYGGGSGDAFVTKINPTGTAFTFSSYLGGNGWDFGYRTATDPNGNFYVAGGTTSTNFKTTGHPIQAICGTDGTCNGGLADAFMVKVSPAADMSITNKAPTSVASGGTITYQINATNLGTETASTVVISDATPTGTTFNSVTSNGGSCTAPAAGSTGTVKCTISTVNVGSIFSVTLVLNVTASSGTVITDTASVSAKTVDPNMKNNKASAKTTVN